MLVASRQPLPVALLPWPGLRGRATIVLKLSFDIKRSGNGLRAARPDPLTPDTWSASGVLLFPSDFVRAKAVCDVLVVGRALTLPQAPASLKATGLMKAVMHVSALGPIAAHATAQVVQHAPADQRLAPPRLPLRLRYERERTIIDAFIPGPLPELAILRWGKLEMLHPEVDTLSLDPERHRITLSIRTLVDGVDLSDALLVVDERATLAESWANDGASWPRSQATIVSEASSAASAPRHVVSVSELPPPYPPPAPPAAALPSVFRGPSKTLIHVPASEGNFDESTTFIKRKATPLWEEEETTVDGVARVEAIVSDPADAPESSDQRGTLPFVRASTRTMPVIAVKAPSAIWGASPIDTAPRTTANRLVRTTANTIVAAPPQRAKAATLPFMRPPSATPVAPEEQTSTTEPGAAAAALPFVKSMPPPPPAAQFVVEETADISNSDASLLDILPQSWPSPKPAAEPRSNPEAPLSATPFERSGFDPKPPAQPVVSVPSKLSAPELSLERYAVIRAEIWGQKEPRGAILKRHGLSELRWRMAERTLCDRLAEEKLGSAVAATLSTLGSH